MNTKPQVQLLPLEASDREQFIKDNQDAFNYGALEEFGRRDDHFEEDEDIISRSTIEQSIDGGTAYRIMLGEEKVGGEGDGAGRVEGDPAGLQSTEVPVR